MSRVTDRKVGSLEWFEMWKDDKLSMIDTMVKNMASDLACGYNFFGHNIRVQTEAINTYKKEYESCLDMFANMDEKAVDRWCYYDMLKRGVID